MKWKFPKIKVPKNANIRKALIQTVVAISEAVVHELTKPTKRLK